jgi:hypothetical protein
VSLSRVIATAFEDHISRLKRVLEHDSKKVQTFWKRSYDKTKT